MLWMQTTQIGVDRVGDGDRRDQGLWLIDGRLLIEQLADRARLQATAARVPSILQNGETDLDLCVGTRVHCGGAAVDRGNVIVARAQAPIVGLAQLADGLLGTPGQPAVAGPHRQSVALGVESRQRRIVFPIASAALARSDGKALTHQGDNRISLSGGLGLSRSGWSARCRRGFPWPLAGRQWIGPLAIGRAGIKADRRYGLLWLALAPGGAGQAAHQ